MNLLFLMTDQQRFDCIGYSPDAKVATPNMDRIAEGCAFMRCQTVNPICQPARTALLTGKYSHQIGTLQMSGDLDFSHPTFPQALQQAGYWTAGVGKFHYLQTWPWQTAKGKGVPLTSLRTEMKGLGYDHVWETSGKQLAMKNHCDYCDYLQERNLLDGYRDWVDARGPNHATPREELDADGIPWPYAEEDHIDCVTGRKIREALSERPKDQPFFLLGSFCSPHKPFDPPQRFLDQVPYEEVDDFIPGEKPLTLKDKKILWKLRRAYKACVLLVDEEIGKVFDLLEAQGVMDDTMIVFTSDHGEMMGDHYLVQKAQFWRESLQVPLAVRHPAHLNAARFDCPVELTDITATLLDAAGVDPQSALSKSWPSFHDIVPCRSLLPVIRGEKNAVRDFAFSECRGNWSAITSTDFKYVRQHEGGDPDHPKENLFHTASDPGEKMDLAADPGYADQLTWHRNRWIHVMESTPPAQTAWAPLL